MLVGLQYSTARSTNGNFAQAVNFQWLLWMVIHFNVNGTVEFLLIPMFLVAHATEQLKRNPRAA